MGFGSNNVQWWGVDKGMRLSCRANIGDARSVVMICGAGLERGVWGSSGRASPSRQVFVTPHLVDGTRQLSMSFSTCDPSPTSIRPGMSCHSSWAYSSFEHWRSSPGTAPKSNLREQDPCSCPSGLGHSHGKVIAGATSLNILGRSRLSQTSNDSPSLLRPPLLHTLHIAAVHGPLILHHGSFPSFPSIASSSSPKHSPHCLQTNILCLTDPLWLR